MADGPVRRDAEHRALESRVLESRVLESWFLDRGLPHFIADYSAGRDIWTRALPALTLLFVVEVVVNAPNRDFPLWLDLVAVASAFLVLLAAWALVNRGRGRPALARPDDIGPLEVTFFVVVPALVPLALGGQVRSALVTGATNIVVLGAIYLATSYALIPTTRWALGRLIRQIEAMTSLLARALPLIALLVTFLFLTTEVWQTAATLHGAAYWMAIALFPIVGTMFIATRLSREVAPLDRFGTWDEVTRLVASTPVADVAPRDGPDQAVEVPPLGRREWGNVALVWLFSQAVQIVIVSLVVGAFFVVLGLLLVDAATTRSWSGQVHVLATLTFDRRDLVVTEELLRVAGFLAAFTGLNFTVYLLTDQTYREEFRDEIVDQLRESLAVRAVYRVYLSGDGAALTSSTMSST